MARDSIVLAVGSATTGLLVYVFFAIATRSLGAAAAAPVSVLWSYWAVAAAVLTFSVQHWIIATLASEGREATVARALPGIAVVGGALSVAAGAVAYAARDALFDDHGTAFAAMVAAVTAGSLFTGVVRGALAGRRRYVASAVCFVSENAVRVAGAIAAALAGADAVGFGLALVVGSLTGLCWVRTLRFEHAQPRTRPVRNPLALMSGIAGGSLIAQVVLTGGPVALAVLGGSAAEVTSLFVALAVWRAPYVVALGVTPQLTGWLSRLAGHGRHDRVSRLRTVVVLATTAVAGAASLIAVLVMPWLLQAIFGPDVELATGLLAVIGIGTAMALGNLVLLLLLLALDRPRPATWAWTTALVVAAGWLSVGPGEPVTRVVTAFLLAQVIAFVALLTLSGGARR